MELEELYGDMPELKVAEALDDDGDGLPDAQAWRGVQESARERAEAGLGGPAPGRFAAAARRAERVFALDLLYRRRGAADAENPWARAAEAEEARLRALANGTESIDASGDGVVISKPARVFNSTGVLA